MPSYYSGIDPRKEPLKYFKSLFTRPSGAGATRNLQSDLRVILGDEYDEDHWATIVREQAGSTKFLAELAQVLDLGAEGSEGPAKGTPRAMTRAKG